MKETIRTKWNAELSALLQGRLASLGYLATRQLMTVEEWIQATVFGITSPMLEEELARTLALITKIVDELELDQNRIIKLVEEEKKNDGKSVVVPSESAGGAGESSPA